MRFSPPPSDPALLPEIVELFTAEIPLAEMPPPTYALFPVSVVRKTINRPSLAMPPPPPLAKPAEFPDSVDVVTVNVAPSSFEIPPPEPSVRLLATVDDVTVSVPKLSIPPPLCEPALLSEIVHPLIVLVPPTEMAPPPPPPVGLPVVELWLSVTDDRVRFKAEIAAARRHRIRGIVRERSTVDGHRHRRP